MGSHWSEAIMGMLLNLDVGLYIMIHIDIDTHTRSLSLSLYAHTHTRTHTHALCLSLSLSPSPSPSLSLSHSPSLSLSHPLCVSCLADVIELHRHHIWHDMTQQFPSNFETCSRSRTHQGAHLRLGLVRAYHASAAQAASP